MNGPDGIGQMNHFFKDDNLNVFRLPVGWQYLVNNNLGGDLDAGNAGNYDQLMQGCLATGASCILDIHNYARWNGGIIGQGGPTDDQFVSLWTQLATKYASSDKVIFGVMNEPHDLDIGTWATTVQSVVTAIRGAGANSQTILLPGTEYTALGAWQSDGSLAALSAVTNPDNSTTGLVFDVHQYLDSDNSGTSTECTQTHADDINNLATALRSAGRQAMLSETGGGNTDSCETDLCAEIAALA
jgi:endoglucanase